MCWIRRLLPGPGFSPVTTASFARHPSLLRCCVVPVAGSLPGPHTLPPLVPICLLLLKAKLFKRAIFAHASFKSPTSPTTKRDSGLHACPLRHRHPITWPVQVPHDRFPSFLSYFPPSSQACWPVLPSASNLVTPSTRKRIQSLCPGPKTSLSSPPSALSRRTRLSRAGCLALP